MGIMVKALAIFHCFGNSSFVPSGCFIHGLFIIRSSSADCSVLNICTATRL